MVDTIQTTQDYVNWANTLDSAGEDSTLVQDRLRDPKAIGYLHDSLVALMNVSKAVDKIKKYLYYGKDFTEIHYEQYARPNSPALRPQVTNDHNFIRLLHAVVGLASEIGELTEPLFDFMYYQTALDPAKIQDESGDHLWYLALIAKWYAKAAYPDMSMTHIISKHGFDLMMDANYRKLTTRYPEKKWVQDRAINKNEENEMKAQKGEQ